MIALWEEKTLTEIAINVVVSVHGKLGGEPPLLTDDGMLPSRVGLNEQYCWGRPRCLITKFASYSNVHGVSRSFTSNVHCATVRGHGLVIIRYKKANDNSLPLLAC